uniref:Uncharacterized protein n=1 Tax=Rhizophora mucronata TaxID=61149 RepID=A0A2P2QYL3_RHIMU
MNCIVMFCGMNWRATSMRDSIPEEKGPLFTH